MKRLRRAHSSGTRLDSMTFVTTQPLRPIMLRMTETKTKCPCRSGRPGGPAQLMTSTAGGNVPTVRLRPRRVTRKAVGVCIEPRGYRQSDSATQWPVTTRTCRVSVARMVETRPKTRKPREGLDRSHLRVRMADSADLMVRVGKLLRMTTGARCVVRGAGHGRTRLVHFSSMAQKTRQSRVVWVVVFELRKIGARALRRNLNRANHNRERDYAARQRPATWPNHLA